MGRERDRPVPRTSTLVLPLALCAALAAPALARGDAGIEKRLSRAREAIAEGQPEKALKALEGAKPEGLADHLSLIRTRLLRETGDLEGAVRAARAGVGLGPPSEVLTALYHEEARAWLAGGDLLAAYGAQRAAWEATRSPERAAELAFEVARAFEDALLPGDALALYRQVWMKWPLTDLARDAYEHSQRLEKATGAAPPSAEELLGLADSLGRSGGCPLALDVYQRAMAGGDLDPATLRRASYGRADCLFALKRYEAAAGAYGAIVAESSNEVRAAISLARSHARNGDVSDAIRQLDAISRRADGVDGTRATYLAAILAGSPDGEDASARLMRLEREKGAGGYVGLARWRLAWADFRAGRYGEAARRFEHLARGDLFDVEVQRGLYWLSVAQLQLGQEEKGREGLRRLAGKVPLSYYGFLAASRIGEAPVGGDSFLPPPRPAVQDPAIERAQRLARAEFEENASLELESRVRKGSIPRENRMGLARLLHEVGDHYRGVRVMVDGFGGALEQGIDPAWQEAWRLAWPRPYGAAVDRAAREFGAEPDLVYAVMREESTYRPDAVSPVGALGLMQIMPPTGERIARGLGVAGFDVGRLFQPETSIRFGSYYLGQLLEEFKGRQPLAIAAYNAGPHVVSDWARSHEPFALDAFVDSVPYDETRRYLRRVLRSYRVYGLLYGEEATRSSRLNQRAREDDSASR